VYLRYVVNTVTRIALLFLCVLRTAPWSAGLVGGEPHGYDAQRHQTEAQPRDGTPCMDLNATALAHTIAIEPA
jgi:hypothetical protein